MHLNLKTTTFVNWNLPSVLKVLKMEEMLNGNSQDEVDQKLHVKEDGMIAQLDDETLRMGTIAAEESFEVTGSENGDVNGKDEKGVVSFSSSSSSSDDDEEVKAMLTEKTDDSDLTSAGLDTKEEDGVLDLTVGEAEEIVSSPLCEELEVVEEVLEVESSPFCEELEVVEVIEEDTREVFDESKKSEEESKVFITDDSPVVEAVAVELADVQSNQAEPEYVGSQIVEAVAVELADVQSNQAEPEYVESQTVEAVAMELADVQSNQVEYVEEVMSTAVLEKKAENAGTNGTLQYAKEEDSYPATAKFSNGTDDSHNKAEELPEIDVNPQIISISARTMQPTSWRGCCGLLEVFKRDR